MTAIAQKKYIFLLSVQEQSLLHKHRKQIHQTNHSDFSWKSLILSGLIYTILICSIIISGNTYQHRETPCYTVSIRPSLYMQETPPEKQKKNKITNPAPEKIITKKTIKKTATASNNTKPAADNVREIAAKTDSPEKKVRITTPNTTVTSPTSTPINTFVEQTTLKSNYWAQVYSAITKEIKYPETARIRGLEGYASVNITINKNGELQKVNNNQFSHKLFLRTVLSAIKRAAPYLPPPKKLKTPVTIDIPIKFKLI